MPKVDEGDQGWPKVDERCQGWNKISLEEIKTGRKLFRQVVEGMEVSTAWSAHSRSEIDALKKLQRRHEHCFQNSLRVANSGI